MGSVFSASRQDTLSNEDDPAGYRVGQGAAGASMTRVWKGQLILKMNQVNNSLHFVCWCIVYAGFSSVKFLPLLPQLKLNEEQDLHCNQRSCSDVKASHYVLKFIQIYVTFFEVLYC